MVPVSGKNGRTRIKAMAADGRDSVDHMQRPSKTHPKRRSAQMAPIGKNNSPDLNSRIFLVYITILYGLHKRL